jgi:hypothetical protein
VRVKAGGHQDEVGLEVGHRWQHLVAPRAPPQQRVEARPGDAHLNQARALQRRVVRGAAGELAVGVLRHLAAVARHSEAGECAGSEAAARRTDTRAQKLAHQLIVRGKKEAP